MFYSITHRRLLFIFVSCLNIENIDIERYIDMFDFSGFVALAAGLSVGMGGLAAGYAIGIVGDYVSIFFYK